MSATVARRVGFVGVLAVAAAMGFALRDRVDGAVRRQALPAGPSWRDEPRPWILGHRGGGSDAREEPLPENTIASATAALGEGAVGVELDVTLTRDRELLLLHDAQLDRTTTCTGCASQVDMADVRGCAALTPAEASGAPPIHDERPPTLAEAMSALAPSPRRPLVLIDAKVGARHGCPPAVEDSDQEVRVFARAVAAAMRAAPHVDVAVTGPLELLAAVRRERRDTLALLGPATGLRLLAGGIAVGGREVDEDRAPRLAGAGEPGAVVRFDGVSVPIAEVAQVAGVSRAQGRLIEAYVANDADAALEAARAGADFIETDRVREVAAALGRAEGATR